MDEEEKNKSIEFSIRLPQIIRHEHKRIEIVKPLKRLSIPEKSDNGANGNAVELNKKQVSRVDRFNNLMVRKSN